MFVSLVVTVLHIWISSFTGNILILVSKTPNICLSRRKRTNFKTRESLEANVGASLSNWDKQGKGFLVLRKKYSKTVDLRTELIVFLAF